MRKLRNKTNTVFSVCSRIGVETFSWPILGWLAYKGARGTQLGKRNSVFLIPDSRSARGEIGYLRLKFSVRLQCAHSNRTSVAPRLTSAPANICRKRESRVWRNYGRRINQTRLKQIINALFVYKRAIQFIPSFPCTRSRLWRSGQGSRRRARVPAATDWLVRGGRVSGGYPQGHGVAYAEFRYVPRPQGLEMVAQADLAASVHLGGFAVELRERDLWGCRGVHHGNLQVNGDWGLSGAPYSRQTPHRTRIWAGRGWTSIYRTIWCPLCSTRGGTNRCQLLCCFERTVNICLKSEVMSAVKWVTLISDWYSSLRRWTHNSLSLGPALVLSKGMLLKVCLVLSSTITNANFALVTFVPSGWPIS